MVEGNPFPPSITEKPASAPTAHPFFGHIAGNYMPSAGSTNATKANRELAARVLRAARAVGETVSDSAISRYDNSNINDGIGDGSDTYTMYCEFSCGIPGHRYHLVWPLTLRQGEPGAPTKAGRRAAAGFRLRTW